MNIAIRRRVAVGAAVVATTSLVAFVMAPAAYAGSISSITPSFAFNNDPSETLTFSTENPFPPGSSVTLTRVGNTADTITGSVNNNSFDPMHPQATITQFADGGNALKDGPANPGQYSVKITQPSAGPVSPGTSDFCTPPTCSFTVLPSEGLAVTGATPGLAQGDTGNVTVSGGGFARGTLVAVLLPDGSVDPNVDANGAPTETVEDPTTCFPDMSCDVEIDARTTNTKLLRKFVVKPAAVVGSRGLRVTNTDGSVATCSACFTVNGAPLRSVSPTVVSNLSTATPTVRITFFGSGLTSGVPSLVFTADPGSSTKSALTLTAKSGTVTFSASGDSVAADFDVRNAAPSSGYQPTLTQSNGVTNTCTCRLNVAQPTPPAVTSVDPKNVNQSDSRTVTINGSNFSRGVLINPGAGITVTSVTFVSPSQVRAQIQVASNAAPGDRDVSATSTDGKTGGVCSKCLTVLAAGQSPSPTPTSSSSPSPQPQGCPGTPTRVTVNTKTINATGLASVTVSGATPNATIELQGYSQNHEGTMTFDADPTPIDRVGKADPNGSITFNDLRPASNTRVRARQQNCSFGGSAVIEVRAQETLAVKRVGVRKYTFSGRSIPARPGGLIVSLYRITGSSCAAGVEPSRCPGETFIGQSRAVALGSPGEGLYSITITFPSRDNNVRDEFVVKTGRDAQNAPGRSNVRSLLIY